MELKNLKKGMVIIMLKQLSIFAENQKGALQKITNILFNADINILGSVTNDSAEYGIIRMIVSDPEKASQSLTKEGYQCRLSDVIGIEVTDKPGALNELLLSLLNSNINVNYTYLSYNRETAKPIIVLQTESTHEVESCLKSKGFATC